MRRIVVMIALAGCGKKDAGPSCEQVVDHMLEVTKTQLMGHENTNLVSQKKAMVTQCEQREMSTDVRTCLMGAQTITEIAKCRGGKTDVMERQRRPRVLPGSASGAGSGSDNQPFRHHPDTVPAGSGSGSGTVPTGSGSNTSGSGSSGSGK